jgi:hypothetical protein
MTTTECAALPVLAKRLFCNHVSIILYKLANSRKKRIKFIYIPMMVHASTMGINIGKELQLGAPGTGGGRCE